MLSIFHGIHMNRMYISRRDCQNGFSPIFHIPSNLYRHRYIGNCFRRQFINIYISRNVRLSSVSHSLRYLCILDIHTYAAFVRACHVCMCMHGFLYCYLLFPFVCWRKWGHPAKSRRGTFLAHPPRRSLNGSLSLLGAYPPGPSPLHTGETPL